MSLYTGIVEKGTARAARLGFPTVNIPLESEDASGIYAAKVKVGGEEYPAAVYADQKGKLLEAHLLDFSGELYGETIWIVLLEKIREDTNFPDDRALARAIASDVAKVREYFKN